MNLRSKELQLNKIYAGNTLDVLRTFPDECVDVCVTSPPYWNLRDYGEETRLVWGSDAGCKGGATGCNKGGATGCNKGGATGCNKGGATGCNKGGATGCNKGGATGCNKGGATGCNKGGATGCNKGGATGCKHDFSKRHCRPNNKSGIHGPNSIIGAAKAQDDARFGSPSATCSKCGAWRGQLGLEPSIDLYLSHLWQITDELYRVLKPTGVMFWNHGDNYGGSYGMEGKQDFYEDPSPSDVNQEKYPTASVSKGIIPKSLVLQNYRLILGMLDVDYRILVEWRALGKPRGKLETMLEHPRIQRILRNAIVWRKLNHMPSSVKDRFSNGYEPVFMLTKNKKYWFDLDAVRVPLISNEYDRKRMAKARTEYGGKWAQESGGAIKMQRAFVAGDAKGKNPGDVWDIPTQPCKQAHFACADIDTEALTKNGWKNVFQLTSQDSFATFDYLNERIIYHKPYDVFRFDFNGELVIINNQWISQHVTPNHRILLKYIHSVTKKRPDKLWHFEEGQNLRPYSGILIPNGGKYEGRYSLTKEKSELLGWIITEGCFSKSRGITIYQSLSANSSKVKRIEDLLKKIGVDYTRSDRERKKSTIKGKEYISHEVSFYIKKKGNNWRWIFDWINEDKNPKWRLLHLSNGSLKALYEGIIAGDGHRRKDDGRDSFIQKNDYVRLWFRTLCVHLGLRTTETKCSRIAPCPTVHITKQNYSQIHQSDFRECVKRKRYKGIVWCPYLPNGTWIAKRKGKIFITGNTFPEKLVQPMILSSCPQWICKKCGKARVRISESNFVKTADSKPSKIGDGKRDPGSRMDLPANRGYTEHKSVGCSDCGCGVGWDSGVVLDPFMGSGTVGAVAKKLGRNYIGIELNSKYVRFAEQKLRNITPAML